MNWTILRTEPAHEKKVLSALSQMGVMAYMPVECRFPARKRGRQWQTMSEVPLCPRLVFVAAGGADFPLVRHAGGFIRDGDGWLVVIPDEQMQIWREAVDVFNELESRKHTRRAEKPLKRVYKRGFSSLEEVKHRMLSGL